MSPSRTVLSTRTAGLVRRTITFVVLIISGLAFAFGFGNGLTLGLQLGVPRWIAGLVSPAVDLTCIATIVSIHYIRAQGIAARLVGPRCLLAFAGTVTLIINTAQSVLERQYGRAAFDAVAPLLLIFWGEVGPGLLALLHSPSSANEDEHQDESAVVRRNSDEHQAVPDESGPSAELIARARALDATHREATGRALSRDRMRAALGVSNALAGELVRLVRSSIPDGDAP